MFPGQKLERKSTSFCPIFLPVFIDAGESKSVLGMIWGYFQNEEVEGELYGVLICEITEYLTEREICVLKDYWTGQMSDGWGEGFEQQPIRIEEGELYVSFWSGEDFWKVMTAEELGIEQEQGEAGQLFRRQKELADEVDKKSLIAKVKSSAGVNSTALSNLLFFLTF